MVDVAARAGVGKVHSVELHNFKSYQGKVTVGPFQDFTCIVGPNGAGKSNIMDALSFVLGGTASQLRTASLTDLINKKARKPECSVTLVLTNPAASSKEKRFTRSITEKGKVEVRVDALPPCAEHEFQTALRRFRIAARLNTFLVFQHEVDAVAQKKARDLTDLIEQVSGSIDFKKPYNEARHRVELANKALSEASSERRGAKEELAHLKLQKQEAEKFVETRERLASERRDLALFELFYVEVQLNAQKVHLEKGAAEVKRLRAHTASDVDQDAMKKDYAATHRQYLEKIKESRKVNVAVRDLRTTQDRVKTSLAHFTAKSARQQSTLDNASSADKTRLSKLAQLQDQLKQQEALLQSHEEKWAKEDKANTGGLAALSDKDLEEYKKLRRDADCLTITSRQSHDTLRRQRDAVGDAIRQQQQQAERMEAAIADDEATVKANRERLDQLQARQAESAEQKKQVVAKLQDLHAAVRQHQLHKQEREAELAEIDKELRELRFVKEDTRHGNRVADAIDVLRSMHPGVRGRLVDLCAVKNDVHKNAVTVAFGKNLEAVVVDTSETAMACVRYLKEQRVASLTFIPLSGAQGSTVDDALRTLGGTCKPVVDLLSYDAALEPAVRFALGRTLVCDTMAEAKRVAYDSPSGERHKVVTIDGNVLLKNGSVQGGLAAIKDRARKWEEKKYYDLKARREKIVASSESGSSASTGQRQQQQQQQQTSEAEHLRLRQQTTELQSRKEYLDSREQRDAKEEAELKAKNAAIASETAAQQKSLAQLTSAIQAAKAKTTAIEAEMAVKHQEVLKEERKVFAAFQKRVKIDDIAEAEHRRQQQTRLRDERRQQSTIAIHKLKKAIEAVQTAGPSAATGGGGGVLARKKELEATKKELDACKADIETSARLLKKKEAEELAVQTEVATLKTKLNELEHKLRAGSRANEAEVRQLATARKQVTMAQAACDALRHKRLSLFQRCRMDEVELPTVGSTSSTERGQRRDRQTDLARDDESEEDEDDEAVAGRRSRKKRGEEDDEDQPLLLRNSERFTSFTGGNTSTSGSTGRRSTSGGAGTSGETVSVDFSSLPRKIREAARTSVQYHALRGRFETVIEGLERELDSLAPNLKASTRVRSTEEKVGQSSTSLEACRLSVDRAVREFNKIKDQRASRFNNAIKQIAAHVSRIYKDLTIGTREYGTHGEAYLSVDDTEEPYLGATRYTATPPMKRYMQMEQLSGGERTMAAMALLFAFHATSPTPFFVLDEVDAALDAGNVERLAKYLRNNAGHCQYIVVSLKDALYHRADGLIGVFKDTTRETSGTLTMDLSKMPLEN